MAANVVNFPSILSIAAGSIFVRLINENLNTAASTFALFSTFFLNFEMKYSNSCCAQCVGVLLSFISLTAIINNWAMRYSSTVSGSGILYSLINILLLIETRPECKYLRQIAASYNCFLFLRWIWFVCYLASLYLEVNGISFMKKTDFYCLRFCWSIWPNCTSMRLTSIEWHSVQICDGKN